MARPLLFLVPAGSHFGIGGEDRLNDSLEILASLCVCITPIGLLAGLAWLLTRLTTTEIPRGIVRPRGRGDELRGQNLTLLQRVSRLEQSLQAAGIGWAPQLAPAGAPVWQPPVAPPVATPAQTPPTPQPEPTPARVYGPIHQPEPEPARVYGPDP